MVMMKTLLLLVIPGCIATEAFGAADVAVTSPDRKVRFTVRLLLDGLHPRTDDREKMP